MTSSLSLSDERWLYWLAGLLEGEGCFSLSTGKSRTSGRKYKRAVIHCNMTDLDVLERIRALAGGWLCRGSRRRSPKHKPIFDWQLRGDEAVTLAKTLLPLMLERRSRRIAEIVSIDASERIRGDQGRKIRTYTGALNKPRVKAQRRLATQCFACGKPVVRKRSWMRSNKVFCNRAEYHAWLKEPGNWHSNRRHEGRSDRTSSRPTNVHQITLPF